MDNKENISNQIDFNTLSNILDTHMISKYWLIALIGALGGFIVGYDAGIIGSALVFLPFHMNTLDTALAVSGTGAFAAIGAITSGPLIDRFGRKSLLIADGIMFAVFSLTAAIATNIVIFIISRILIGYAIGTDFAVAPVYLSEISPISKRGRINMIQQIMIFVSGVFAFVAGYVLSGLPSSINWRWMIGLGVLPAILLAGLRTYLPESPRWLAVKGRINELEKSLKRLGIMLEGKYKYEPPSKVSIVLNKRVLLIVGLWIFFEIASGINVFLYYGPKVFVGLGFTGSKAILSTLILDAIASIGFVIAFFIIDKSVKKLASTGYSLMFIGMLLLSIGSYFINSFIGIWLVFAGILIFFFSFQMAMGNSEMVLIGTAVPKEVRGIGAGLLAGIAWATSFAITFIFPFWNRAFGFTSFAVLEAILCLGGLLWTIFMLPEVSQIPIEKVPQLYMKEEQ